MSQFSPRVILSHISILALLLGLAQASFSKVALASDCSWSGRPDFTQADINVKKTVTVEQIAFDLCYVAGQLYQRKSADGWMNRPKREQIMRQMEQVVAETNFLSICPTQGTEPSDQHDADHAVPDHTAPSYNSTKNIIVQGFGCGPYPHYKEVAGNGTYQPPMCASRRPLPYDASSSPHNASNPQLFVTGHPPTKPETAAFDLCHASTIIANKTMQPKDLNTYVINLMVEVNLALTCAGGRPADSTGTFSVPSQTNADYIANRKLGCSPVNK
jgi:hypothetical protein